MSQHSSIKRLSVTALKARKGKEKIVCLTAYSAPMAKLLDEHIDLFIVGDSVGMVLYGMQTTLPVTLEMMVAHGKAVASHSKRAFVLVDMPFGSYQQSPEQAFKNAARLMQETGCGGVKLEGGAEMVETVRFLSQRGIPVMAHIGLRPQHVHAMGGYKLQGRNQLAAQAALVEAKAFEQAGAFGLLLEGMAEQTARQITQALSIPTIGIGASPACDGQVLVTEDMLGLFEQTPKFVQQYADIKSVITKGVSDYTSAVRAGSFPAAEHCAPMKED